MHTAAVSTPVGPPPQTTKLSNRLRSSSEVDGSDAVSKLSEIQIGGAERFGDARNSPSIRRRMPWASPIVLSWKQCWRPGTP